MRRARAAFGRAHRDALGQSKAGSNIVSAGAGCNETLCLIAVAPGGRGGVHSGAKLSV